MWLNFNCEKDIEFKIKPEMDMDNSSILEFWNKRCCLRDKYSDEELWFDMDGEEIADLPSWKLI